MPRTSVTAAAIQLARLEIAVLDGLVPFPVFASICDRHGLDLKGAIGQ